MFSNAKEGQRVWSYTYGWGEIVNIKLGARYPIDCDFEIERHARFTINGKEIDNAINQDLFYDEIKVEIPESAKKLKIEWKFPCYGKTSEGLVVYFEDFSCGTAIPFGKCKNIGEYFEKWNMTKFTPCTLEPKEIKWQKKKNYLQKQEGN